jgi:hypothetical protein
VSAEYPSGAGEVADLIQCMVVERLTQAEVTVNRAHIGAGMVPVEEMCGQLNVMVERVWRTLDGAGEARGYEQCVSGLLAVDLLVMLTQCIPIGERRAPGVETLTGAYNAALAAGDSVWNALDGALPGEEWERISLAQDYTAGQGGGIAIETRVTIVLGTTAWFCG